MLKLSKVLVFWFPHMRTSYNLFETSIKQYGEKHHFSDNPTRIYKTWHLSFLVHHCIFQVNIILDVSQKIWCFRGSKNYLFFLHLKGEIHSFPSMKKKLGGVHVVKMAENKYFLSIYRSVCCDKCLVCLMSGMMNVVQSLPRWLQNSKLLLSSTGSVRSLKDGHQIDFAKY